MHKQKIGIKIIGVSTNGYATTLLLNSKPFYFNLEHFNNIFQAKKATMCSVCFVTK